MSFQQETLDALRAMSSGHSPLQYLVSPGNPSKYASLVEQSIQAIEYMPLPYPLLTVAWRGETIDPDHYLETIPARNQPIKHVSSGIAVVKLVLCGATAMLNSAYRYLPACDALLREILGAEPTLRGVATVFASGGPEAGLPPHRDDFVAAVIVQLAGAKVWYLRTRDDEQYEVRLTAGQELVIAGEVEHSCSADPHSLHCTFQFDRSMPPLPKRVLSLDSWIA